MTNTPAIDTYLMLREGDKFTLRGRTLTVRIGGPGGCFSSRVDGIGERYDVPVWNDKGRPTLATIRPNTTIRVVEHKCQHARYDECDGGACGQCTICDKIRHYGCLLDPQAAQRGTSDPR